jgi:hypothetical protein
MADDPNAGPRKLRTFTPEQWAQIPKPVRTAFNNLRRQHHLPPYPEPEVDLSPKPYVPPPKPFDQPTLLQCILAVEGGENKLEAYQEFLAQIDSLLGAYDGDRRLLEKRLRNGTATPEEVQAAGTHRKRPAHREKTLRREIAEYAAGRSLYLWEHWQWEGRGPLKVVLGKIKDVLGISRSEAHKILRRIRKREK